MSNEREYVPLRVILPVTSIGVFMSALDGSIVNVALPTIANAYNTNIDGIKWVVIVYLLMVTSLIGIAGSFGDTYGRKKVFQGGMVIFAFGSFLCSISTNLVALSAARALQAIGGAALQANGLALVVTYINPQIRGRAIGINSLVVASALTIGPPLGGVLTDYFGWPSIFLINIPIGIIGIIAVQLKIDETERKDLGRLDYTGMVLFAVTSFALVTGISIPNYPLPSIGLVVFSLITGYLFIKSEQKQANPILSIKIMKQRQITFGAFSAVFAYMGLNTLIFLLPFYFQDIKGFSETKTGIYLVVFPIALTIMGPPTGFLAEKIKAKKLASFGAGIETLVVLILGILFYNMRDKIPVAYILLLGGLTAAFLSVFTNSNGTSVMNASEKENLSIVSGIIGLSRNIGFTLGVTISSTIFNATNPDVNKPASYTKGLGITYMLVSIFIFIGMIISLNRGQEIVKEY